jgi:DNA-binding CsgD family transcriptional regulator
MSLNPVAATPSAEVFALRAGMFGSGSGRVPRPFAPAAEVDDDARADALAPMLEALDQIDYGVVLWPAHGAVRCNRTASQQLAAADGPLRWAGSALVAADAAQTQRLHLAVADAASLQRRRLVTLRSASGTLTVAVAPVGRSARGTAMLVLGRRSVCPQLTVHWFCVEHRFTPTESVVFAALLEGLQPSVIAQRQGVALSTVRTQVGSIKEKTGTRCVRDLLLAVATLPPLVPIVSAAT